MRNLGIVAKLWLAFTALVVAAMVPLEATLYRLLSDFYASQVSEPLLYHSTQLAATLAVEPEAIAMAPLMGRMVGGEVVVLDPGGAPLMFPGISRTEPPRVAVARAMSGEPFFGSAQSEDGKEYLVTAVPIGSGGGVVVLFSPAAPLQRSLDQARRYLMLAGVGTILLGTGMAFMVARSLVRPVVAIEKVTGKIAQGDFAVRVDVTTQDEIGRLASAVNEMTARLQAFEQRRREFLANVAHELRTPLSYIRGYTQAVIDGVISDPADRDRYLKIVHDESLRLTHLVNDLMDLAQIEEGQLSLEFEQIDLRIPIEQAAATIQPIAKEKGVDVTLQLPSQMPLLSADGGRMQQVMLNLLDNALRHTPAGGQIVVSSRVETGHVLVEVADTGSGLEPELMPLVFERFHKHDSTGRGLGLAIVRSIVKAHGGTVGGVSTKEKGAVFWIRLPLRAARSAP